MRLCQSAYQDEHKYFNNDKDGITIFCNYIVNNPLSYNILEQLSFIRNYIYVCVVMIRDGY